MDPKEKFLVVDDDQTFADILCRAINRRGFTTQQAHSENQALEVLQNYTPDKIILDLKLGQDSGLILIKKILALTPAANIIILTGYSSISTAVEAIKLGATNYLCKPASADEILNAFAKEEGNPTVDIPPTPPSVDRVEWEHIQKVLNENNGNISATARALGMHRRTLQRKLQKRPVSR